MGLGGISIWQLLIILLIIVMLFGTKRLKSLGGDLGDAIKGFRKSMNTEDEQAADETRQVSQHNQPVQGEARKVEDPARKP
jgi:sec-independent protein translocase protein TatA